MTKILNPPNSEEPRVDDDDCKPFKIAEIASSVDDENQPRKRKTTEKTTTTTTHTPTKKAKKSVEEEFDTSWICCECKEAECLMKPEADTLMICEGPCRRLFHYPCAGLTELPNDEYICQDCKSNKHSCSICQEYGIDNQDVFKCTRNDCGLFFHENCLAMQGVLVEYHQDEVPVFTCYSHECFTCTQRDMIAKYNEERKSKSKKNPYYACKSEAHLVRCIECALAFHITCIPLAARFHEIALLCHKHASLKLPELDHQHSLQSQIEQKIEQKFDVVQKAKSRARGYNPFLPGIDGAHLTDQESEMMDKTMKVQNEFSEDDMVFCLPCDLKDAVYSKPPGYKHLQVSRFDPSNKPKRHPRTDERCECVGSCGEECMNRVLYVECCGGDNGKGNCNVGPGCGNRQIGQRKHKKTKVAREQGRGWGLKLLEGASKGDLITEYVGEVIDSKEKERRLTEWAKDHPNDPNFYIMSLGSEWYLDARLEGNFSRFINHSCGPNCILLPINIDGFIRNGIFALRDIEPGEFLSYDYHFDTKHADQFSCRCGADSCRGSMQGGFKALTDKSEEELWEEAKALYDREKRLVDEFNHKEMLRMNLVGYEVPAANNIDESVPNGVQTRHKHEAMANRIFLWRNAVRGSNFASRFHKLRK